MEVKKFKEFVNESALSHLQDEMEVIRELSKLYKNDEDKADRKLSAFKKGASFMDMTTYRKYMSKGKYKSVARLIKKVWG